MLLPCFRKRMSVWGREEGNKMQGGHSGIFSYFFGQLIEGMHYLQTAQIVTPRNKTAIKVPCKL